MFVRIALLVVLWMHSLGQSGSSDTNAWPPALPGQSGSSDKERPASTESKRGLADSKALVSPRVCKYLELYCSRQDVY